MKSNVNGQAERLLKLVLMCTLPGLLMTFMPSAAGNPEKTSTVHISANSIKLEAAKRRVLYSGNVRLLHRSLTITGSKAVTTSQNSGSGEVTITGNPVVANFIDARGKTIRLTSQSLAYNSATQLLLATGSVELHSGKDMLSGQKMKYDMKNDYFSIEGDRNAPRISAILNIDENNAH